MRLGPRHLAAVLSLVTSVVLLSPTGAFAQPGHSTTSLDAQVRQQLRAYPGGVRIASNVVAYRGGSVRVVFPLPGATHVGNAPQDGLSPLTNYIHGCPYGTLTFWFCFYKDANWGGRMLEFKDCYVQWLHDYGFAGETSSWVDTSGDTVDVWDNTGATHLWTEGAHSSSSYVGNANNDRADKFDRNC